MIIANLDCTIICQKIRLERYKNKIANNISLLLNCDVKNISETSEVTINKCFKKLDKMKTELIPTVILKKYKQTS